MKTLLASLFGATMLLASGEAFASKSATLANGVISLSCSTNEGQCEFWVEKVGYNVRIFPASYPYGCGITKASSTHIWSFSASSVTGLYFGGSGEDDALFVAPDAVPFVRAFGKGGKDAIKVRVRADLDGGDGNDCLEAADGTIHGGEGDDIIGGIDRYVTSPYQLGGLTIYGQNGKDTLYGTQFDDHIDGGNVDDLIYGYGGNDDLYGGDDNNQGGVPTAWPDYIYGGDGDDYINGGVGFDQLFGEAGDDYILGGDHSDYINGGDGNDYLSGEEGDDIISAGSGDDYVEGNNGNDDLFGNNGLDELYGGSGDDYLFGGDGFDELFGGIGDDTFGGCTNVDVDICTQ
jgi:Ca2+-binding RTX toxin-like protein